jgi:hypothetical protein
MLESTMRSANAVMIGLDLLLGSATLVAADRTLEALGHERSGRPRRP